MKKSMVLVHRQPMAAPNPRAATYAQLDEKGQPLLTINVPPPLVVEMGHPDTPTITVQPGDHLNGGEV